MSTADHLFPSEDEIEERMEKKKLDKGKKRSKPTASTSGQASSSGCSNAERGEPPVKKSRVGASMPRISPIPPPHKATARELFGTDSEDEDNEEQPSTSVPYISHNGSRSIDEMIKCEKCNIDILKSKYPYHMRTNIHKSNCLIQTELENIYMIASAFKNRIATYKLNPQQEVEYLTPEAFLKDNENKIQRLIEMKLLEHGSMKINFELFANYMLPKLSEQQLKSFNLKYETIYKNSDIHEMYSKVTDELVRKLSEFDLCESGWTFVSISHLEININKYCPLRGGTFIDLPPFVKNSKSCINIQNNDQHCFLWSVVAALYPAKNNVCRTSSYPHYNSVLNIEGMSFPPSFKDINVFEMKNNEISINVYGLDRNTITGPLYMTSKRKNTHINLLYFEKNYKGHYCLIKDLKRLVRRQVTHHNGQVYLCEACLQFFTNNIKYENHNCSKILTVLPEKNSILQFKNFERKQRINFVIYADFESLLANYSNDNDNTLNTEIFKLHEPSCFAYYVCCSHDSSLNKYVNYRGPNSAQMFIDCLIEDVKRIHEILSVKKNMKPLTNEQENSFLNATSCHICGNVLLDDKVRDHDHVTSEYRGAAHSHCNLMYRVCPFIPVVIHNLSGYDSHIFIEELTKHDGSIKIIPKTKEKYLTITKVIHSNKSQIQIKFIDSYQFLSSSLDTLSKNLSKLDFVHLSKEFPNKNQFNLLTRKGVYPYDYMNSWEKYEERQLPSIEKFYNSLTMEHLSEDEYNHALNVWEVFNIQSLGEYTDLYLKCDVLLLCDIFENFRNLSLRYYNLDPAYYVTSPSLSWDAMLLNTGVKLELINDLEMYQMLENGIRGGLAQCSLRHAKANNMYMADFDETKPSSYLVYLDSNNLYGFSMMKRLPMSDFKFMSQKEIVNFEVSSIPDDSTYGYILEVDLQYPDYLHSLHSDLPFAAEKFIPIGGKSPKLIASLYDKFNYIIHYVHLKQCLEHGLVLRKVHRILCFRQETFLKNYIDLNTKLRQAAASSFEKDFFKLMNNAVFGKTIENKRKQLNVKLVTKWNDDENKTNKKIGAEKLIAKPNLKHVTIFSENFAAIQLSPDKIVLDKPIYIGFTVLEYSKQHLYKFHYNFIKNKYHDLAKLCYTDTDSLLYLIYTNDFYEDMSEQLSEFDTSNFASSNAYFMPRVNSKVPGLFKDELGGDIITEFTCLRAKLYYINSQKTQIKKAKGVNKSVTNKLKLSNYNQALLDNKSKRCTMNIIKSMKHILYSQKVNKLVLCRNDDKRQILSNQIETVPWGHCETIF